MCASVCVGVCVCLIHRYKKSANDEEVRKRETAKQSLERCVTHTHTYTHARTMIGLSVPDVVFRIHAVGYKGCVLELWKGNISN